MIYFSKEEEDKIINSYLEGISRNKLAKEYKVSDDVILRILRKNNIKIRGIKEANSKRKYDVNDSYFNTESPNMAYIMGLWAADGNVSSKENRLDLELASLDLEILEKIKEEINSERPIKIYECSNGYTKNKLLFWSSEVKKRFKEYGIVPNKTYSKDFKPPYKLDKKYWIHYIRGFFDGDGSVKKATSLSFELNSTNEEFLIAIQKHMKEYYQIEMSITTTGMKDRKIPVYRLYCYGDKAKKIYHLLYRENSLFLKRKKERFEELMK